MSTNYTDVYLQKVRTTKLTQAYSYSLCMHSMLEVICECIENHCVVKWMQSLLQW